MNRIHHVLTILVLSFCFSGCSNKTVDPLTAPISEVQNLQNKINANIKSKEDYYNKKISEISKEMGDAIKVKEIIYDANKSQARKQILESYLEKMQAIALERDAATAGLKAELPSNILLGQFNAIMTQYNQVYYFEKIDVSNQKIISKIIEILNQLSPADSADINSKFSNWNKERENAKDAEFAAKERGNAAIRAKEDQVAKQQSASEQSRRIAKNELILQNFPKIESAPLDQWKISITYGLISSGEIKPTLKVEHLWPPAGLRFNLSDVSNIVSAIDKYKDWSQKVQNAGGGNIKKQIAVFGDDVSGTQTDFVFETEISGKILLTINPSQGIGGKYEVNEAEKLLQLFDVLPSLEAKAEQALNERVVKSDNGGKIADELK